MALAARRREFMSVFTNSQPTADDLVADLRSELRRAQAMLVDESRRRAMAEADAARLRRNAQRPRYVPAGDEEFGYECGNPACNCGLLADFDFCPGCGCEVDWRVWAPPEDDGSAFDRRFDR